MVTRFENRAEAGALLSRELDRLKPLDPVVYALPRGGLPVAAEVARRLGAPLDLVLVRKIGAPGHSELAVGAVADGAAPTVILHHKVLRDRGVSEGYVNDATAAALKEIERRRFAFENARRPVSPEGRVVVLVDDGLATGATMEAAVAAMRAAKAKRVIVAVPTAPVDMAEKFRTLADEFMALSTPEPFWSVGSQYRNFPQLTDADVVDILMRHNEARPPAHPAPAKP
ncbi:MAG: phosphoribosyltransferase [Parvularculaceae bacterium]|nr:phosphoribosyltransferase [Parvularculaceae bacterium]